MLSILGRSGNLKSPAIFITSLSTSYPAGPGSGGFAPAAPAAPIPKTRPTVTMIAPVSIATGVKARATVLTFSEGFPVVNSDAIEAKSLGLGVNSTTNSFVFSRTSPLLAKSSSGLGITCSAVGRLGSP